MTSRQKSVNEYDTDSEDEKDNSICHICGDIATGRHYGAIACNGCKGFFRRTVRRGYRYNCRFSSKCVIDKHNRAVCRYCRYMKCVNSGMKEDQVQNERDVIGKRIKSEPTTVKSSSLNNSDRSPQSSPEASNDEWKEHEYLLNNLLRSESTIQSLRDTVIKQIGDFEYTTKNTDFSALIGLSTATLNDVLKSMHSQLLLVIEWARTLPQFTQLATPDQTLLLKNFAGQHVTLCVAYRSKDNPDVLKLLNDRFIPRASKSPPILAEHFEGFYLRDCEKVMDQLVAPMRFLKMDDIEFVALKACILFNPVVKGLSNEASVMVLETRRKIFAALEQYIRINKPKEVTRIGDLTFFILTPLCALAQQISEDIMFTKVSGAAQIDHLMQELILTDGEESSRAHRSSVSSLGGKECATTSQADHSVPLPTPTMSHEYSNNSIDVVPQVTVPTTSSGINGNTTIDGASSFDSSPYGLHDAPSLPPTTDYHHDSHYNNYSYQSYPPTTTNDMLQAAWSGPASIYPESQNY